MQRMSDSGPLDELRLSPNPLNGQPKIPLQTPVLFVTFNRLTTTKLVLDAIRKVRPARLFVVNDGPRDQTEAVLCKSVRDYIENQIDWPCELNTLYQNSNLGCGLGLATAISWFFDNVEKGIILEDDCVPGLSFFAFCEELLARYENDPRIMLVSGYSLAASKIKRQESYSYIRYPMIWGWASWRRVWNKYDYHLKDWPDFKTNRYLERIFTNKQSTDYWNEIFETTYQKAVDTWDYQLTFLLLSNSGLCIVPNTNLITNVGFGEDATHTKDSNDSHSANTALSIDFPMHHPKFIVMDAGINAFLDRYTFSKSNIGVRLYRKVCNVLRLISKHSSR